MNKFVTKKVVETFEINYKELADRLEELVIENLKHDIEDYRGDRTMMSMHMEDTAQYLIIIACIANQDIENAKEALKDMDTFPRETFYEMFEKETGVKIYEIKNF